MNLELLLVVQYDVGHLDDSTPQSFVFNSKGQTNSEVVKKSDFFLPYLPAVTI